MITTAAGGEAIAATCSTADRERLGATARILTGLRAADRAGADDVASVLVRARRRCASSEFALYVAALTRDRGPAVNGRRYTVRGIAFVGLNGTYRLDVPGTMRWWGAIRSEQTSRTQLVRILQLAIPSSGRIYWSPDPTRLGTDVVGQALAVRTLAASRFAHAVRPAHQSAGALASSRYTGAFARADLLVVAPIGIHMQAALSHMSGSTDGTRALAAGRSTIAHRLAAAALPGWSTYAGRDATLAEHRRLLALAYAMRRVGGPDELAAAIVRLRNALSSAPQTTYTVIPRSAFYPWPQDGSHDTTSVSGTVDKPGTILLYVYDEADRHVATTTTTVPRGTWTVSWNGANTAGSLMPPGSYRYLLQVTDLAGNGNTVPGLGGFRIGRDTTPPRVASASGVWTSGDPARRIRFRWLVREPISPRISVTAVIARQGMPARYKSVPASSLHGQGYITTWLGAGTYALALKISDGSGNVTVVRLPAITVT